VIGKNWKWFENKGDANKALLDALLDSSISIDVAPDSTIAPGSSLETMN